MFLKRTYRHSKTGRIPSIIHVRSVGHHIFLREDARHIRKIKKYFLELFWGVRGKGKFRSGSRSWILNPGEVCFYFPGDLHDIAPDSDEWDYYWISFDGEHLETIIRAFDLKREPVKAEECPAELFNRIYELMRGNSIQNEYLAGAYAFEVLNRGVMGLRKKLSREIEAFFQLVAERYSSKCFGINEFCDSLNIHRSTLFRKMKKECGMTPLEYLISYRVGKATEMIQNKKNSMDEIAKMTGFSSENYFSKAIRRTIGVSPREISSIFLAPRVDCLGTENIRPPNLAGQTKKHTRHRQKPE